MSIEQFEANNALQELTVEELDMIIGGGKTGAVPTVSHDCHMNSWQFLFTCCS